MSRSNEMVLSILLDEKNEELILGRRKRKPFLGEIAGPGGFVEPGCDWKNTNPKETYEELEIISYAADYVQCGLLFIDQIGLPLKILRISLLKKWEGEPKETKEMIPVRMSRHLLRYDEMIDDYSHWLELLLALECFYGIIRRRADFILIDAKIWKCAGF